MIYTRKILKLRDNRLYCKRISVVNNEKTGQTLKHIGFERQSDIKSSYASLKASKILASLVQPLRRVFFIRIFAKKCLILNVSSWFD